MRRAFTLIELVVAIGILAIILSFAGLIFRVSAESQQMAMANAEIMQKLRVITEQLDADFRGWIVEHGGYWVISTVSKDVVAPDGATHTVRTNFDGLLFFANGDFQSTQQYDGQTIVGNVASIYYGAPDPNSYRQKVGSGPEEIVLPAPRDRILLRRQTILAPEAPQADSRWDGEYYCVSLEQWRTEWSDKLDEWMRAPVIEPNNLESQLPMYLAQGVDDFTVHYLPQKTELDGDMIPWERRDARDSNDVSIDPAAFKVTFTLYDSKGVLKKGRTFTHIVLVDG